MINNKVNFPFKNANLLVLDLNIRTYNALLHYGVGTIYDLVLFLPKVRDIRNIGEKSQQEIKEKLVAWVRDNNNISSLHGKGAPPSTSEKIIPTEEKEVTLQDLLSALPYDPSKYPFKNDSIEALNLRNRTDHALRRNGIYNILNLIINFSKLDVMYQIGRKAKEEINTELDIWVRKNVIRGAGLQVGSSCNGEAKQSNPSKERDVQLTELFSVLMDRQEEVLTCMFGLRTGHTMTLQETSDRLGVTRERVRQIKKKALECIRKGTVQLNSLAFSKKAEECIIQRGGVISETRLVKELQGDTVLCSFQASGVLELLKEFDQSRLKPRLIFVPYIEAWTTPAFAHHLIDLAAAEMQRIIESTAGLDEWEEIYAALLRHEDLLALDEKFAFAIAISLEDFGILERMHDGRWTAKVSRNHRRKEHLIDVLMRIDHPAHFREIARGYQELYPDEYLGEHATHAIIGRYNDTFTRVGRGIYGLTQWGLSNDGTIANTVRRLLIEKGEPISFTEIRDVTLKTWQVEEYSIYAAILQDARFTRTEDGKIALTEQGYAIEKIHKRSDTTRRERIMEVLRLIQHPLHSKELTKQHNDVYPDTPLTEAAIYGVLNTNPGLFVRVGTASFALKEWDMENIKSEKRIKQPTYKECLIQAMDEIGRPAKIKEIIEKYILLFPDRPISRAFLYSLLSNQKNVFLRLSKGVYTLAGNSKTNQPNSDG